MLTEYAQYKNYFRQLAADHVAINDFVFGGSDRIISRRNSKINYPCLWLTTPTEVRKPDGHKMYDTLIVILTNVRQDHEEEDEVSEQMKVIANDIYLRLKEDANKGLFNFGYSDVALQPKFRAGSENDTGWSIDCDITFGDGDCYDPEKFRA
jgi:hypothetical protein